MALTDNLVSYWKLDEASGNAADSVGGNTLTNTNTVTYSAGKINNGANFASASSQQLKKTGGVISGATAMSISYWVKTSTTSGTTVGQYSTAVAGVWWIQIGTGTGYTTFLDYNGSSVFVATDTVNVADGNWHFVVVTINSGLTTVNISTDGSSFRTYTITSIGSLGNQDFALGFSNSNYLNGSLDEVGIWSRELTSGEVTSLYNGGAGIQWPFVSRRKSPSGGVAMSSPMMY